MTSNRKKGLLAAGAVTVIAAAIVLPLTLVNRTPAPKSNVFTPPSSIADNCSVDVTQSLAKWLYGVDDVSAEGTGGGGPGPRVPSVTNAVTVQLRKGCYLVNGSMFLRNFRYFTLENGTIEESSPLVGDTDVAIPNGVPYCGLSAGFTDGADSDFLANPGAYPIVEPVVFEGGCHITLKNLTFKGPNKGTAGGPTQQDTFITFAGTQFALVKNVKMVNPYGDCIDSQSLHEVPGALAYKYPATNITATGDVCEGTGRQGMSIILANKVDYSDDILSGIPDAVFDIEVDAVGGYQDDITIDHNKVTGSYAEFISAQTGSHVDRLQVLGNVMPQMRVIVNPGLSSTNLLFASNTATTESSASGFDRPGFWIMGTNVEPATLEIANDTFPLNKIGVFWGPKGSLVCGNTGQSTACPTHSPVTAPAVASLP